jgi:hypothetical protein
MKRKLCPSRFIGLFVVLIGISALPIDGVARHHGNECRENILMSRDIASSNTPIPVLMDELQKNPENYYGKTVQVQGELHRDFTSNVFTIEGDKDVLVIGNVPKAEAVYPLEDSLDRGKEVSVTGLVVPFDRGKLECAYGPLHIDGWEGHSFTKNPVLIVDKPEAAAMLETPPPVFEPFPELPAVEPELLPEPLPEPALAPEPEPAPAAEPESLPQTAGQLTLLALAGLLALSGGLVKSGR